MTEERKQELRQKLLDELVEYPRKWKYEDVRDVYVALCRGLEVA